jgi:hypothetical protein
MIHDFDPEGRRLPIKVDSASNGEYAPRPLSRLQRAARAHAAERVGEVARRLALGRRPFLKTLAGAAATLLAFNEVFARAGVTGGRYAIPDDAAHDLGLAEASLGGDEFIFDIQTHCVDPSGDWAKGSSGAQWRRVLNEIFGQRQKCVDDSFQCYSAEQLVKEVFLDSDTDVAVVSALWGGRGSNPTPIEYAAEARALMAATGGSHRGLIHGGVMANEPGALEFMEVQARDFDVAAWKTYPQWGPDGVGYFMDDPQVGLPMIEKARALGVKVICAHRGLTLGCCDPKYANPADIARVARLYPDVAFICYHSGFEPDVPEGPYRPDQPQGVDRLIKAHQENGFSPNQGNLYAELGSVWRHLMSKPDQAAHFMGKLLKYFGEERICWGTDALWYGSPADQIQTMRTFEIAESLQEEHGYPALTREAKRRIFGLNAAAVYGIDVPAVQTAVRTDALARLRQAYAERPNPSFQTFGPKTRREFVAGFMP